ncbi:hypothetical protein J2T10_002340 [Paenarthrobacter nicotinovorans]|uniref:DUF4259 domain-containing protein n=2 Tax=Paenarthrobacter nicotinovorans TaxID=29320 RepID=A0ABT9TQC2_PAENI|nr:hypothetical protein [Paenarthrobacter nicotinovorans]
MRFFSSRISAESPFAGPVPDSFTFGNGNPTLQRRNRELLGSSHDGGAYSLWMEISDLYDSPAGPGSEEACEEIGRKAATEWLSVDKSSPDEIDKFFARWQTPEPWQIS